MRSTTNALVVALVALALGQASPGFADDKKGYPGVMCRAHNSSSPVTLSNAGIRNTASSTYYEIICPIVRDNTSNTDGLADIEIRYQTFNSATVYCEAYSVSPTGSLLSEVVDTDNNGGSGTFNWNDALNESESDGYYWIHCALQNGYIRSYIATDQ